MWRRDTPTQSLLPVSDPNGLVTGRSNELVVVLLTWWSNWVTEFGVALKVVLDTEYTGIRRSNIEVKTEHRLALYY